MANIVVQGRVLDEAQLQAIRALVEGNPVPRHAILGTFHRDEVGASSRCSRRAGQSVTLRQAAMWRYHGNHDGNQNNDS
jgi:hypothetical protein